MHLKKVISTFLKIGAIGFGGGSALIPIIENDLVMRQKSMEPDDFVKHTVVANITPGALPVKLGATCGYHLGGPVASVFGAYCVALPGTIFTVLIIALFSMLGQQAVNALTYASVGISVFIVFLLMSYIIKTIRIGSIKVNILICAATMFLTFGKEVREIIECVFNLPAGALGTAIFDISIIQIMILSFYLIIFTRLTKKRGLIIAAFVLSGFYAFFNGKLAAGWSLAGKVKPILIALIVLSVLIVWLTKPRSCMKRRIRVQKGILISIAYFIVIPVLAVIILLAFGLIPGGINGLSFLGNTVISTVTSFGGGEAYVAIAESVFVQGGYVASDLFYTRVIPVANALPGPILVKVASAIGFVYGQISTGSMIYGISLAAVTAMVCIGVCSSIAMLVLNFYDIMKESAVIRSLKKYILSVICGILIPVSLSMFYQAVKVAGDSGFNPAWTFMILAVSVALTYWLHHRFKLHDMLLLCAAVVVSLGVFYMFGGGLIS